MPHSDTLGHPFRCPRLRVWIREALEGRHTGALVAGSVLVFTVYTLALIWVGAHLYVP